MIATACYSQTLKNSTFITYEIHRQKLGDDFLGEGGGQVLSKI